ncbi:AAA family ATPase [Colletotrichum tofieldiae]|nr:AAA family ATPase [Colletotrichum tofieldiae]
MRFGLQFLDELVILTAKELGSSLVSINSQDLEDIGLDFYYQKKGLGKDQTDHESASNDGRDDSDNDSDGSDGDYDTPNIARKAAQRYFGVWTHHFSEAKKKRSNDALCREKQGHDSRWMQGAWGRI